MSATFAPVGGELPTSSFPHSGTTVRIDDETCFYFGEEAQVHFVIARYGHPADPILILERGNVCITTVASKVTVLVGLRVSL